MSDVLDVQSQVNAIREANVVIRKRLKRARLASLISLQLCAARERHCRKMPSNQRGNPPAEYSALLASMVPTFYGAWIKYGISNPVSKSATEWKQKVKYGYRPRLTPDALEIWEVCAGLKSQWLQVRDNPNAFTSSTLSLLDKIEADKTVQAILARHDKAVEEHKAALRRAADFMAPQRAVTQG